MRNALIVLVPILCAAGTGKWEPRDPLENPGFVHFYNNEFDAAIADFEKEVQAHPNDCEAYNHLAQGILYRELFRNGALESQLVTGNNPFLRRGKMNISAPEKARFSDSINTAIQLSEKELKVDPNDLHSLYCDAVAHGFRANYLFLVEKAWVDSLKQATAGRKQEQKLIELDPTFVDARLGLGVHDYIVGSLPFYMRAFGLVAGFHGDKEAGIRQIEQVRAHGVLSKYDAEILLAVIYRRERRPNLAIPLLKQASAQFPRNYLFRFEQVQMYSDMGDESDALQVISELERLRSTGAPGYRDLPPEKIEYIKDNLLFWYNDFDPALSGLKQVTQRVQDLDLSTAVLAWLRLGQIYDLKGDHEDASSAYREAMRTAPQSEAAAEAKGYLAHPYKRARNSG
ncbi:MAG TPA: tetratricopeptide repeat protein [Bryobacteraceae bacterium]|nr:tetratricopeptide repeat protein [Bryobacteraceae bacterium]